MSNKKKSTHKSNIKTDYSSLFTEDFLLALANWQKGWNEQQDRRRDIADKLVEQCSCIPGKFKHVNKDCYRKRFLVEGEFVNIFREGQLHEGIASWTTDVDYARKFKKLLKEGTKFTIIFKHKPKQNEVIVSLPALWKNTQFISAAERFRENYPESAKPLFNFKDNQSEVITKSILKLDEIENIVGISHHFDDLCDQAGIPECDRERISKQYEKDTTLTPISTPIFVGRKGTKNSLKTVITKMRELVKDADEKGNSINWPKSTEHEDDLKHFDN